MTSSVFRVKTQTNKDSRVGFIVFILAPFIEKSSHTTYTRSKFSFLCIYNKKINVLSENFVFATELILLNV